MYYSIFKAALNQWAVVSIKYDAERVTLQTYFRIATLFSHDFKSRGLRHFHKAIRDR